MKQKFEKQVNESVLGQTIQAVRKRKHITQEELGRRVGLPKSSISKIENGQTNISFEDAALLVDAMGEKLSVQLVGAEESLSVKANRCRFVTTCTIWYAYDRKLAFADAYNFLLLHQGIKFLEENFEYEQTLPRDVIMSDLDTVTARHGGNLKRAV